MTINQVTIIGAGLIGGSIAKALSKNSEFKIICIDRDMDNLSKAFGEGIKTETYDNIGKGVEGSDLVFICTPVIQIPNIVSLIVPHLKNGAIITDVGSTKGWLIDRIKNELPAGIYFIGGHPMAGSEKSGYQNSSAGLFKDARYILIQEDDIPDEIFNEMKEIIGIIGANPISMNKKYHDSSVAAVSHLPYITSICLSCTVSKISDDTAIEISAGSLRDMTRISASSINMWKDICITNKQEIKNTINKFREELDEFSKILDEGNSSEIEEYLVRAKQFRQKFASIKKM